MGRFLLGKPGARPVGRVELICRSLYRRDLAIRFLGIYYSSGPSSPPLRVMPHTRPRRHQLAKISEESMTVDAERQPLLQQVKSREDVYEDADLPEDWCFAYKWGVVALLAFMAFTV
jgi:hypothetical protein